LISTIKPNIKKLNIKRHMISKKVISFILLILGAVTVTAQITFQKTFGGSGWDKANNEDISLQAAHKVSVQEATMYM